MAAFVKGDVVVVPFPFSGTPGAKRRPAIVLVSWPFASSTDYMLCLISAKRVADPYLLPLAIEDIEGGSLARPSYVRPTYLFTADEGLILYKVGRLKADRLSEIIQQIVSILT